MNVEGSAVQNDDPTANVLTDQIARYSKEQAAQHTYKG